MKPNNNQIKVILNPLAGQGSAAKKKPKIYHILNQAGIDFNLVHTTKKGDAIALAKEARLSGYQIIAVAGGDGTVNEVINGLATVTSARNSVGTLAILPVGSGNDLASTLGWNGDWQKAVSAIAYRQTRYIDLGYIQIQEGNQNFKYFFHNNVGIGFEGSIAQETQKIKHFRGIFIYLVATFLALRNYYQPYINVKWQLSSGNYVEMSKKLLMISLGNNERNGGGFRVTPNAILDDGLLDIAIADSMPWHKILTLLPKVIKGNHITDSKIILQKCSRVLVNCNEQLPIHADGNFLTANADNIDIQIQPKRLQVIYY
jgi:YegS/Rv2252/BmrU family lipid kinase